MGPTGRLTAVLCSHGGPAIVFPIIKRITVIAFPIIKRITVIAFGIS